MSQPQMMLSQVSKHFYSSGKMLLNDRFYKPATELEGGYLLLDSKDWSFISNTHVQKVTKAGRSGSKGSDPLLASVQRHSGPLRCSQ